MPRKIYLAVICVLTLSYSAFGVSPQPPNGNNTSSKSIIFDQNQPMPIPMNSDPVEITFNVQGVEGNVWDIDLETFIKHFTPNDLTIILTSPSGKSVTLMSHEGKTMQQTNIVGDVAVLHTNTVPPNAKPDFPFGDFNLQFFNEVLSGTLWDDQAEVPVSQIQYSTMAQSQQATLQPESALDAFRGVNPNGSWKLTIIDKTPNTQITVKGTETWEWTNDDEGFPIALLPGPPGQYQVDFVCDNKQMEFQWGNLITCDDELIFYDANLDATGYEFFFRLKADSELPINNGNQELTSATLHITSLTENHPFKWAFATNNPEIVIQDASITSSDLIVTNLGDNLKELELFTELQHNFCSDLKISLTSPSQKTVLISGNNGGNFNNLFADTFWDDHAATPITDAICQDNVAKRALIPEGKLAAFRGENPNGKWTLGIVDQAGNNSSGLLLKWGLRFNTYIDPIEAPPALTIPSAPSEITTATFTFTNAQPAQIQNFQPLEIPFHVENLPGTVWSVNLTTFITHVSSKDLELKLTAPSGEEVVLSSKNGYQHGPFNQIPILDQNINQPNNLPGFPFLNYILPPYKDTYNGTHWNDQADSLVADADYNLGDLPHFQFIPEGSFDLFKGINPNGVWKLSIVDTRDHQSIKGIQRWLDGDSAIQESFAQTVGTITNSVLQIATATGKVTLKERSFTNTDPIAINDLQTKISEIHVADIGNVIEQVKVFTKITHPKSGEIDIKLIAPSGRTIILSTGNGGENADVFSETLWNDRAPSDLRVTGVNFVNGQAQPLLIPEGALSPFRGENPNGKWTLVVSDTKAGGDTGNLQEWSLQINSYLSSLPPIDGFPHNPKPLPPSNFTKGKDYVFGQKGKVAYLLKQEDGKSLSAPITLGNLPAKHKIVAANHFAIPGHSNQVVCVILQNKTQLFAKAVGANGSSFSDAALTLPTFTDRKDKLVASGDVNRDGFNDFVIQGRRKNVQAFLGPEFSPVPLTNIFKKYGKIVGVADGKILTRKKGLLYATTIGIESNGFTSTTTLIGNGLKSSLKIRGVADILKKPGLELITQEGNKIGYGPLNLNGSFGYLHTNRTDLTLGKAVGPK
jgi:subtilisin-like proprotein convertase family protein